MNALATASFLAFGALLVLFGSSATEIIESLDLEYNEFGLVAAMLSLGLGVGILSAGPLVDRLPRRPLFVAACLVVAAAALSLGEGSSFTALLFSSFSIGLGAGFYETLLNAVIVEESGRAAARRLLFIHAAATVGASLTPFVIGLLREPLGLVWYDTFHAAGIAHAALLFAVPLLPRKKAAAATIAAVPATAPSETRDATNSSKIAPPLQTADSGVRANENRTGRFLLAAICLSTFAYVGTESAYTFFIADHARQSLGLEPGRATGIVGFFWIGLLFGRLAVGLSKREPSASMTSALAGGAALISATFFADAFGSSRFLPPELVVAATGFCLGGVFPIMIGLAGSALPRSAGTAVGLAGGLGSLGGFVIPWWTGIVAEQAGLPFALATLTGWLLLLSAAAFLVHHRVARHRDLRPATHPLSTAGQDVPQPESSL